jgi:hypothetical protein
MTGRMMRASDAPHGYQGGICGEHRARTDEN